MAVMTATKARSNLYNLIDQTKTFHEPIVKECENLLLKQVKNLWKKVLRTKYSICQGVFYCNCKTSFFPRTLAAFVKVASVTESLYGFKSLSRAALDVLIFFAISVLLIFCFFISSSRLYEINRLMASFFTSTAIFSSSRKLSKELPTY